MRVITPDEDKSILEGLDLKHGSHDSSGLREPPLDCTRDDWKRLRNVLAYLLMLDAGLRVGEVTKLGKEDCYFDNKPKTILTVPARAAKGNRGREVPCTSRLAAALRHFITIPFCLSELEPDSPLITGKPAGTRLQVRSLQYILFLASIRTINFGINPHMLRHTFATRLMKVTDMRTVQTLLGHVCLTSTQVYTHPTSDDQRKAIDGMSKSL